MGRIEILLIEDNPADVLLTKEVFKEIHPDYIINWVKDGFDALKYINKQENYINANKPDLILLDLNLPKKDGRVVLKEIKSISEFKNIPVIILSTSKSEQDIYNCYKLQANCYLTKPVELNEFIDLAGKIHNYWIETVKYQ